MVIKFEFGISQCLRYIQEIKAENNKHKISRKKIEKIIGQLEKHDRDNTKQGILGSYARHEENQYCIKLLKELLMDNN